MKSNALDGGVNNNEGNSGDSNKGKWREMFRRATAPAVAVTGIVLSGQVDARSPFGVGNPDTPASATQESFGGTLLKIEKHLMYEFKDAFLITGVSSIEVAVSSNSKGNTLTVLFLGSKNSGGGKEELKSSMTIPVSEDDCRNVYSLQEKARSVTQDFLKEHLPNNTSSYTYGSTSGNSFYEQIPPTSEYNTSPYTYDSTSGNISYVPTSPSSDTSYGAVSFETASHFPQEKSVLKVTEEINSVLREEIDRYGKGKIILRAIAKEKGDMLTVEVATEGELQTNLISVEMSYKIYSNPETLKALLLPVITKSLGKQK